MSNRLRSTLLRIVNKSLQRYRAQFVGSRPPTHAWERLVAAGEGLLVCRCMWEGSIGSPHVPCVPGQAFSWWPGGWVGVCYLCLEAVSHVWLQAPLWQTAAQ